MRYTFFFLNFNLLRIKKKYNNKQIATITRKQALRAIESLFSRMNCKVKRFPNLA